MGISILTLAGVAVLDFGLALGFEHSIVFKQFLSECLRFPWSLLVMSGVGIGIGALAVILVETLCPRLAIHSSTLWALVLCLLLGLWIKLLLYLPGLFVVSFSQSLLVGLVLGVFGKGRRYWR
jgi:hypothetical protein